MALAVAVGLAVVRPVATAQDKPVAPVPLQPPAPAGQLASSKVNLITQAALKVGVLACTSRINQVANFLTAGAQGAGAFLFPPPAEPDQQLISVSIEIPVKDAASAYASASFAPNQANGCGGMYETVAYWPQGCDEVARRNFSGLKRAGTLAKTIAVLDAGASIRIFVMPAGTGCISIKKEVVQ